MMVTGTMASRTKGAGGFGTDFDLAGGLQVAKPVLTEMKRQDFETQTLVVAGTLQANGKAAGSATQQDAESGMLVAHTLRADGFDASEDGTGRGTPLTVDAIGVRRLTPTECERLQGWPDHWTRKKCKRLKLTGNLWFIADATAVVQPDGPRYRQIGNGVTSNVPEWIAKRMLKYAS